MKNQRIIKLLFAIGLILILCAPYVPDFIFNVVYKYDTLFSDFRFIEIVPSICMAGIILSTWGIALYVKEK